MTAEHQQRAAEWVLIERAGLLDSAHIFITDDVFDRPQTRRARFNDPDPGPVVYGTGLDAGEGLWLRQGWAGRG